MLYIGRKIEKSESGADQVNLRNQIFLEKIYDNRIKYLYEIKGSFVNKIFGGVSNNLLSEIKDEIEKGNYEAVFISQSLLGRAASYIKCNYPKIKVISFFHNIEKHYAKEYVRTKGITAFPFYMVTKYWEKSCVRSSDYIITLNNRDAKLLYSYYGVSSDLILPTSFKDRFNAADANLKRNNLNDAPIDYLFVGVSFFANVQGCQWFIDNVMPYVSGHFWIVGKGMDCVKFSNVTNRIHILGFVESLDDYYYKARVVVSPIFVGGGMKTKTAEALMFGKRIIGTKEAFEGYEKCNGMYECNTADDFISAINSISLEESISIFNEIRQLFKNMYSYDASEKRFEEWFYNTVNF